MLTPVRTSGCWRISVDRTPAESVRQLDYVTDGQPHHVGTVRDTNEGRSVSISRKGTDVRELLPVGSQRYTPLQLANRMAEASGYTDFPNDSTLWDKVGQDMLMTEAEDCRYLSEGEATSVSRAPTRVRKADRELRTKLGSLARKMKEVHANYHRDTVVVDYRLDAEDAEKAVLRTALRLPDVRTATYKDGLLTVTYSAPLNEETYKGEPAPSCPSPDVATALSFLTHRRPSLRVNPTSHTDGSQIWTLVDSENGKLRGDTVASWVSGSLILHHESARSHAGRKLLHHVRNLARSEGIPVEDA